MNVIKRINCRNFVSLFKNSEMIDQDKTPHFDIHHKKIYLYWNFLFDKMVANINNLFDWDINTNSKNIGISIQSESVSD